MNSYLKAITTGILYPNIIANNFLKTKKINNKQQFISVAFNIATMFNKQIKKDSIVKTIANADKYYKNLKSSSKTLKEVRKDSLQNNLSNVILDNIPNKFTKFVWLPSDSENPSIDHMQYYGLEFDLDKGADGNGLLPGQRPNCKCGMQLK